MQQPYIKGTLVDYTDQMRDIFAPVEGQNAVYYGRTRNGKTRTATADILELLKRGEPVFANWQVSFEGYDERSDWRVLLVKFFFPSRNFYVYDKSNFHYIDPIGLIDGTGDININTLNRLVGAHLFIDEGQWVLPSQDKAYNDEQIAKMKLVLHGGHYCRSLNIITQRHQNISKNTRSQINVWYRCVKRFDFAGFMLFQRFEIEDMKNDEPIEFDDEGSPLGRCKTYFVVKKSDPVFKAYNTHAMRQKDAIEVPIAFQPYRMTRWEIFKALAIGAVPRRFHKERRGESTVIA